jgi:hypothetical protein
MTEAERIWRAKSDDDLIEAAAELSEYTEDGRRVIRAELHRRGLEDPVEQAGFIVPEPGVLEPDGTKESVPGPECLRCEVEQRYLGTKKFREGANWGVLGELGHLFEHSETFDIFVCPTCGHVDFYVDGRGGNAG